MALKQLSKEKYSEKGLSDFEGEAEVLMYLFLIVFVGFKEFSRNLRPHNNLVQFQGIVIDPLCIVS